MSSLPGLIALPHLPGLKLQIHKCNFALLELAGINSIKIPDRKDEGNFALLELAGIDSIKIPDCKGMEGFELSN